MRKIAGLLLLTCACTVDSEAAEMADADTSETGDGDGDSAGDGDGDPAGDGDGDGDDEPLVPADLPVPTGACPEFSAGNHDFYPAGAGTRTVKLWVGDDPQPGGMIVLYWHAFGSAPDEAVFTLTTGVIDAITAAGGVVAAPYPAADVGQFPWFVVNGSSRPDDMLLGDEIVACAIEQLGADPARIHATGMSAGGLQTTAYSMQRSRYIASAATFSGGAISPMSFEDPSNRFAAMIIHGGETDVFGGAVHFDQLSEIWRNQLTENGNFSFVCDHGNGHTIPQGLGDDVINFFYAHPFGTEPAPYAAGLPDNMPDYCGI